MIVPVVQPHPVTVAFTTRGREGGLSVESQTEVAYTLKNPGAGGRSNDRMIAHCAVTHSLRADGFEASEDGTGRGTPLVPVACSSGPVTHPLGAKDNGMAVGFYSNLGTRGGGAEEGLSPTLKASESTNLTAVAFSCKDNGMAVAFDTTQVTSKHNYSNPKPGDPCHPLASSAHPPAVAFQGGSQQDQFVPPAGVVPTLAHSSNTHGGHYQPKLWDVMQVRRLTPRECERLQGFPDGYLDIEYRGKRAADGPKYKALGNSFAVNVLSWIGERLQQVIGDENEKLER